MNELGRVDFDPTTMTVEQEFERQMGIPFNPDKFEIKRDEGSNSIDGEVVEQLIFYEKVPKNNQELKENIQEESITNPSDVPGANEALQNYKNSGYDVKSSDSELKDGNYLVWEKTEMRNGEKLEIEVQYDKNAFGQFYNPNIDEYDADYNPVNDPLFNNKVRTSLTKDLNDEELLVELMRRYNSMGSIINKDPYIGMEDINIYSDQFSLSNEQMGAFENNKRFVK